MSVLKSFSAVRISKLERENYELTLNPMTPPTTTKILRMLYYDYRWLSSSTSSRFKTLVFAKHLQAKWNIDHLWHVPLYMSMRMAQTRPRHKIQHSIAKFNPAAVIVPHCVTTLGRPQRAAPTITPQRPNPSATVNVLPLGINCRGGPPWPPQRGNTMWQPGAATEGRPYSCFSSATSILSSSVE